MNFIWRIKIYRLSNFGYALRRVVKMFYWVLNFFKKNLVKCRYAQSKNFIIETFLEYFYACDWNLCKLVRFATTKH